MSPMGDSGGRSAGNRTGEGARRRNTPRERQQIDPPWDQMHRVVPVPMKHASWIALAFIVLIVLVPLVLWSLAGR